LTSPRRVGLWSAAALGIGHTIGVGIFLTPAGLVSALASPALALGLWLGGGLLVLAGALTFGELASRYPESGGLYVYLRETMGRRAAFLYGWQALLVMDPGIVAALAAGLAQYAVVLQPAAAGHEKAVALAAIWLLALANMAGFRPSVAMQNGLTAVKLLALSAIVAGALRAPSGSFAHFAPFFDRRHGAPPLASAVGLGLIAVFYSFGGFWEASRVAGEIRDPARTLPRALALGVGAVTVAYVAVTTALILLVPIGGATSAADLARAAGGALLGPSGPRALSAVVCVSVAGSALALLLMAPRLYLAMARDGLFPAVLAAAAPRTGAPARATAFLAAVASLLVLLGSFGEIVAYFLATTLVFVGLAAAGVFRARRDDPGGPAFRVPGFPATPALFLLFLAAVVASIAPARPVQVLAGFALVLLGVPAYALLPAAARKGKP
jgi:APA family basic amino acid/polyamine antiporter